LIPPATRIDPKVDSNIFLDAIAKQKGSLTDLPLPNNKPMEVSMIDDYLLRKKGEFVDLTFTTESKITPDQNLLQ